MDKKYNHMLELYSTYPYFAVTLFGGPYVNRRHLPIQGGAIARISLMGTVLLGGGRRAERGGRHWAASFFFWSDQGWNSKVAGRVRSLFLFYLQRQLILAGELEMLLLSLGDGANMTL